MPSDLIWAALIAAFAPTLAVVVAAWSASKKLDHITVLTNSNLQASEDKAADLEARLEALKAGELKAALDRIDKLEAVNNGPKDQKDER